MNNDAKRMPTWTQHRCNNSSEINAKHNIEQGEANHEQTCFSKVEEHANSLEVSSDLKVWQGECANGKFIKHLSRIIQNSILNR